jgi:hypothetical protein
MLPQFIVTNYDVPVDQQVPIVGLSGVIYGLVGILWMGRLRHPEFELVCHRSIVQFFVFWFFFCIVMTYAGLWPVANVAHGAGLVFGFLYGRAMFDTRARAGWIALATVATLLVLATLVYCPGHNGYEFHRNRRLTVRRAVEVDVTPGAVLALPDARLLEAKRDGLAVLARPLHQAHAGHHRGVVAEHADFGRGHRGVVIFLDSAPPEIEAMKVHPLDQVPSGLGLEGRQRGVAQA